MNYYEILGVDRNASSQELKRAYKKLAKKWHPDLNRDNLKVAEEKMKEINIAYSTLSDEVARLDYNKKLDAETAQSNKSGRQSTGGAGQKTSARTTSTSASGVNFEDINKSFSSFFGFDPKTHTVTDEDKLNTFAKDKRKKNPLDTGDLFEKFMGFKA